MLALAPRFAVSGRVEGGAGLFLQQHEHSEWLQVAPARSPLP
jgi:hypothetical protein